MAGLAEAAVGGLGSMIGGAAQGAASGALGAAQSAPTAFSSVGGSMASGIGAGSVPAYAGPMLSSGPVQGGSLGQTVGQMQAGPMGLGPSTPKPSGRTAQSALSGMSRGGSVKEIEQYWDGVMSNLAEEIPYYVASNLGSGGMRVDNPPPQIGPMSYNRSPIQPPSNTGLMGLSTLAASYGRR